MPWSWRSRLGRHYRISEYPFFMMSNADRESVNVGKKVVEAFEREKVIAEEVIMRCDGDAALFSFNLLGLRRDQGDGPYLSDECSVLEGRLRRVFPRMSRPRILVERPLGENKWRKRVEFSVPLTEIEHPSTFAGGIARDYQGMVQTF